MINFIKYKLLYYKFWNPMYFLFLEILLLLLFNLLKQIIKNNKKNKTI